jgi:hypothetical protein
MTRIVITTEQVQAMIDRLRAGSSSMKAEAAQLGMGYAALRHMLEQVIGLDVYLTVMTAQRVKRAKLPPSRNFLTEPV